MKFKNCRKMLNIAVAITFIIAYQSPLKAYAQTFENSITYDQVNDGEIDTEEISDINGETNSNDAINHTNGDASEESGEDAVVQDGEETAVSEPDVLIDMISGSDQNETIIDLSDSTLQFPVCITEDNAEVTITGVGNIGSVGNLESLIEITGKDTVLVIRDLDITAAIGGKFFDFISFTQNGTVIVDGTNKFINTQQYPYNASVISGKEGADITVEGTNGGEIKTDLMYNVIGTASSSVSQPASMGMITVRNISIHADTDMYAGIGAYGVGAHVDGIKIEENVTISAGTTFRVGIGAIGGATVGTENGNAIHVASGAKLTMEAPNQIFFAIGAHAESAIKGNILIEGDFTVNMNGWNYFSAGIGSGYGSSIDDIIVKGNLEFNSKGTLEAGIGAGGASPSSPSSVGNVYIHGGNISMKAVGLLTTGIGAKDGGKVGNITVDSGASLYISSETNMETGIGASGVQSKSFVGDIAIGTDVIIVIDAPDTNCAAIGIAGTYNNTDSIGKIMINSGNILQSANNVLIEPNMSKVPVNMFDEELKYYRPIAINSEQIFDTAGSSYEYKAYQSGLSGFDSFIGVYLPDRIMLPSIDRMGNTITIEFEREIVENQADALSAFQLTDQNGNTMQVSVSLNGNKVIIISASDFEKGATYSLDFIDGLFKDKAIGYWKSGVRPFEFKIPKDSEENPDPSRPNPGPNFGSPDKTTDTPPVSKINIPRKEETFTYTISEESITPLGTLDKDEDVIEEEIRIDEELTPLDTFVPKVNPKTGDTGLMESAFIITCLSICFLFPVYRQYKKDVVQ